MTTQVILGMPEFERFRAMIYRNAGITLTANKHSLVAGRLSRRLRALGLACYSDYLALIEHDTAERQRAVDSLTTNETYFFREQPHFEFIRDHVAPQFMRRSFRCWSAASSTGQEAYSLAMLLHEMLGDGPWDIFASDINTDVLASARRGLYPLSAISSIPQAYLKRYCLKGVGSQDGLFKIDNLLQRRIRFEQVNLNEPLGDVGTFDVIFLRNVLIYFDADTKRQVVGRLLATLKPGGYLIVGHCESLYGLFADLQPVLPSVYRKYR